MKTIRLIAALVLSALGAPFPFSAMAQASHLVVSPGGPYTSVATALADAQTGGVIEVRGGLYPAIVIDKAVILEGSAGATFDGGGKDVVVAVTAPDVTVRGFNVRGSGSEPDRDHSGIIATAPRTTIENNTLTDVLFGIFLSSAPGAIVRNNDVTSMQRFAAARKGDAIRLWQSSNALIENNHVHAARDVVVWYSKNVTLRGNTIETGRYGVHLMYCDGAVIERNLVRNNSVGIYTMYSNHVTVNNNEIRGQWGPSGYALGFKDTDYVETRNNLLVDNRGGIYIDGMPFSTVGFSRVESNVIAFNDVGIVLMPAVRGNVLRNNTFWENVEHVALQGGNASGHNTWLGNFWSDYQGYDLNGDGVGDQPYLSERGFENLLDREGLLRAFIYSPAVQAIEFAANAMPLIRPQPKLVDDAPIMSPLPLPPTSAAVSTAPMAAAGMGLLIAAALAITTSASSVFERKRRGRDSRLAPQPEETNAAFQPRSPAVVESTADVADHYTLRAMHVGKRYGAFRALTDVSFDAQASEAIALWGANGAGKSTLIKSILGLTAFDGAISVTGYDVISQGKAARRSIGYVPQDVAFHDMSVRATLLFYAQLKRVGAARVDELLDMLGIEPHASKQVSALSGGLRQRLALAVALLADPPVLLLDEPTANLDAAAQHDYLALLSRLRSDFRKTIIFASHRLEEVEMLAQRVLYLEHGRLIDTLPPHALTERLMPLARLTLWVGGGESARAHALERLTQAGWNAHLNGRGTVVIQLPAGDKMKPIRVLDEHGIDLVNFEIERGQSWN